MSMVSSCFFLLIIVHCKRDKLEEELLNKNQDLRILKILSLSREQKMLN